MKAITREQFEAMDHIGLVAYEAKVWSALPITRDLSDKTIMVLRDYIKLCDRLSNAERFTSETEYGPVCVVAVRGAGEADVARMLREWRKS